MQNPVDLLGVALKEARLRQHLTQQKLADKLHMNVRTIIEIEHSHSNPRFETVALLARELNLSLDAVLFPETTTSRISKSVIDFFSGKTEKDIQKYLALCQQADLLKDSK